MTKIVDLRGDSRILGPTNPNRSVTGITKIARHHSATATGDVWAFQNHWRNLGWGTGGYHEIILRDGSVQLIYRDNVTTNGVGNHNSKTYHICLVGNGSFTAEQEKAFDERAKAAMQRFNLKVDDIIGHNEFSGHGSNSCPGTNMTTVRNRLRGSGGTAPAPNPTPNPAPNLKSNDTIANEVIAGKWGNGTDRERRLREAGYNPQTIQALVNQKLGASATKPTPAPQPALKPIGTIAQEVIDGKWGNGADREKRLKAAGYNPATIQAEVNRRLGVGAAPKPAGKTVDQLAREVIRGDWGNEPQRSQRLRAAGYDAAAVQRRVNQLL